MNVITDFYQFKYSLQSKEADRTKNLIIGLIASIYGIWLVVAAGLDYLLLTMLLFAPGILVFRAVQKEENKKLFTKAELIVAIVFVVLAVYALYELITGNIAI